MVYAANPYLTGSRVYNGGTNNATSGPMQYEDIAKRQVSRAQNLNGRQLNQRPTSTYQGSQPGMNVPSFTAPTFGNRTDIDTLKPPTIATPTLPIDMQYTQDLMNSKSQWDTATSQLEDQMNQANQSYTTQARGLTEAANKIPSNVLAQMALSGLGRSSVYTDELSNQLRGAETDINDLIAQQFGAEQSYIKGRKDIGQQYSNLASQALTNLTQRLEERAKTNPGLGLGATVKPGDVVDPGSKLNDELNRIIREITNPPKPIVPPAKTNPIYKPPVKPVAKPPALSVPSRPSGIFRQGSSGTGVKSIQTMLNNSGAKLKVDGSFGSATTSAIKAFQKAHGLVADGIVGPKTLAALWGGK